MFEARIAAVVLGACAVVSGGGALAARPAVEVQGHRGARAVRPENTLPAFELAIAAGADTLELDLAVTRDDRLAVTHDPVLNPDICLGPDGERFAKDTHRVRALSFAELQRFDCGALVNPRFPRQTPIPGTRIPSLEQVFALARATKRAKPVLFNIEMKMVPGRPELAPPPERFAELLAAAIEKSGLAERITVQSFDHRALIAIAKRLPKVTISALTSDNRVDYVAVARAAGAGVLSPDREWITREDVAALHAAGVRVIPWTANEVEHWKALLEMGVDGIITDDPEGLIRWLSTADRR